MAEEKPMESAPKTEEKKSSTGMDPKLVGLLSWLFAPITSIIFMVMDDMKQDDFIQYHAKTSLYYGIANMVAPFVLMVLLFIPFVNILAGCLMWLLMLGFLVGRIYFMVKAYNGEKPEVPIISNMVK